MKISFFWEHLLHKINIINHLREYVHLFTIYQMQEVNIEWIIGKGDAYLPLYTAVLYIT